MEDILKRVEKVRDFPANTCGASRHAQMIGEALVRGEKCWALTEEPERCGESILAVVAALYEARTAAVAPKGGTAPAWKADKDAFDALDDGHGPHNAWMFDVDERSERKQAIWRDFVAWATDHLGQGYSLACYDGSIVDHVTSWAFKAFLAGRGVSRAGDEDAHT